VKQTLLREDEEEMQKDFDADHSSSSFLVPWASVFLLLSNHNNHMFLHHRNNPTPQCKKEKEMCENKIGE
jgi:hypothetical protein